MRYSRYTNIENRISAIYENGLEHLIRLNGVEVEVFEPKKNKNSDVYGSGSGEVRYISSGIVEGLVLGDDFFPVDLTSSGTFEQGWFYVRDIDIPKVRSGSRIEIVNRDGLSRRYMVERSEDIGTTVGVFQRYKLSALGD